MSYRVFARKYRPQTFDEVVGQDHITRTLQNAVSANRLAQAYLFVGPRGIGKTSTARILAKALNCVDGPTTTPCGVCDACKEITDGRSLDVIEIDGASNNGVENIRDLRDNAAYAPARGPFKIYLIDEVHMLSTGAFNALLKTLEEPPPHVKFIFATTEAQKLPATITSRCQRFDLRRIPTALIAKHLTFIADSEKISLDPAAAEAIARGAEGGLRDAESMLDQMVAFCGEKILAQDVMDVFGFTSKETVVGLTDHLFARNAAGALGIISEQSDAGKDLSRLTSDLIAHLRDLLVSAATGQPSPVPQGKLLDLVDHFGEAETRMKWVADKKLQLDVAVIKALHLLDETSLTDVIETLTSLGGGSPAPRPTPAPAPVARPEPAAAPAPRLQEKPEPAPKVSAPPAPADPDDAEVSAATTWEKTAESFAKESFIRYGWLREGLFERFEDGKLFVRFPASSKENSESIWMEKGIKDLETSLTRALSRTTRLVLEWDESLVEQPEPVLETNPSREEPAASAPPEPAPPADPMEDFKNDPLIKKALELFKSTLQTTPA
ncbi:MAG: DNA polymerase III subunit gamma/tau [Verrucomicrobia bacterium]|nr:DNA polymerase III subunit gamma/tau [Verrucomicrobiota bacterium]